MWLFHKTAFGFADTTLLCLDGVGNQQSMERKLPGTWYLRAVESLVQGTSGPWIIKSRTFPYADLKVHSSVD